MVEAETGVSCLQAKERQGSLAMPEPGRDKARFSPTHFRVQGPAHTLTAAFHRAAREAATAVLSCPARGPFFRPPQERV